MQESMGSSKKEIDEVKLMILDTNPYFLGLTVAVTLLHSVFDFLAFKNGFFYFIFLLFFSIKEKFIIDNLLILLLNRYFFLEE